METEGIVAAGKMHASVYPNILEGTEEVEVEKENIFTAGGSEAKSSEWDEKNVDLKGSGKKLKKKMIECCKKEFPGTSPIDFIEKNIPSSEFGADFEEMNKNRKAVQYDIKIEEKEYPADPKKPPVVKNWWTVEMDADRGEGTTEPKKFAHFGFTVQAKGTKKTSGHIYLKEGQAPPYVRPALTGSVNVQALPAKKEKKGGADNKGNVWYELTGDWSAAK